MATFAPARMGVTLGHLTFVSVTKDFSRCGFLRAADGQAPHAVEGDAWPCLLLGTGSLLQQQRLTRFNPWQAGAREGLVSFGPLAIDEVHVHSLPWGRPCRLRCRLGTIQVFARLRIVGRKAKRRFVLRDGFRVTATQFISEPEVVLRF